MALDDLNKLRRASKRIADSTRTRNELICQLREEGVAWAIIAEAANLHVNACMRIVKGQDAYR